MRFRNKITMLTCRFKSGRQYSRDHAPGFLIIFTTLREDKVRASGGCHKSFSTLGDCTIRGNFFKRYSNKNRIISTLGQNFNLVGNSLIRYGREELPYESAHRRCLDIFKANVVVFRNKQEWIEARD